MTTRFTVIAAMDRARGIGKQGMIPWQLASDLEQIVRTHLRTPSSTAGMRHALVVGRRPYALLGDGALLPASTLSVVVTDLPDPVTSDDVVVTRDLSEALHAVSSQKDIDRIYVLGSSPVLPQALTHPGCDRLEIVSVDVDAECDDFFPEHLGRFVLTDFEILPAIDGVPRSAKSYTRAIASKRRRR